MNTMIEANEQVSHSASLSTRVLGELRTRSIVPKPRWHYLFKEWVIRVVALVSFVVGSIATALTIYIANAAQFMEYRLEWSRFDVLADLIPFVWLGLLAVGVVYTIYAIRHLRKGYRYHSSWLVGGAVVASIATGELLHAAGLSEPIDRYLLANVPIYGPMAGFRPGYWMSPPQGLVVGSVEDIEPERKHCTVGDLAGDEWNVDYTRAELRGDVELREGALVRIHGTTTDDGTFLADEVKPFQGRGGVMGRPRGMGPGTHMGQGMGQGLRGEELRELRLQIRAVPGQ